VKVLFLDFDGVLNNQAYLISSSKRERRDMTDLERRLDHIDPDAVERLNEVVDRTDCAVVVSSTWRVLNTKQDLQHYLELKGYRYTLLGCTPRSWIVPPEERPYKQRGSEIQMWIEAWDANNPDDLVDCIAIVDDDRDMIPFMDRLVNTYFTTGLRDEHVEQLVSLLGEPDV
jgi:hypothetical protein